MGFLEDISRTAKTVNSLNPLMILADKIGGLFGGSPVNTTTYPPSTYPPPLYSTQQSGVFSSQTQNTVRIVTIGAVVLGGMLLVGKFK